MDKLAKAVTHLISEYVKCYDHILKYLQFNLNTFFTVNLVMKT